MNETIEYVDWIECRHKDVIAAGSPFLHGLLHAYQSPIPRSEAREGASLISPRLQYTYNVKENYNLKVKRFRIIVIRTHNASITA